MLTEEPPLETMPSVQDRDAPSREDNEPVAPDSVAVESELVEEISIDGMCGVY